jgi:hypothetical protein
MLRIVPITFKIACSFIRNHHRHHAPPVGHKFSIGLSNGQELIAVAVAGRPVSRMLDNGYTLEVTRVCTDGSPNACSKLYASCWRIGREMGYTRMITYILYTEMGTSLRAAGWRCEGKAGGGSWDTPTRRRGRMDNTQPKIRFAVGLATVNQLEQS